MDEDFSDFGDMQEPESMDENSSEGGDSDFGERPYCREENSVQANYTAFRSRINEFYLTEKYTDVSITCPDGSFKCHRLVLAAASEYFDTMFNGGFKEKSRDEIHLQSIDAATFTEILNFAYTGKVAIDDSNVYNLLCASDMLGLNFIESRCVCYLIERTIPKDCAVDLFSFACRTRKNSLISTLAHFIIDELDDFSKNSKFLRIPLDELRTWLAYCPPLSSKREYLLLSTMLRCVSLSTCAHEQKSSLFVELTKCVQFQHVSAEYIAQYFYENVINSNEVCDSNNCDVADLNSPVERNEMTLHAYFRISGQGVHGTHRFTLHKRGVDIEWRSSNFVELCIDSLETAVLDDRIYSFSTQDEEDNNVFDVYCSADLSMCVQSITVPADQCGWVDEANLCNDENRIYWNSLDLPDRVNCYIPELGKWDSFRSQFTSGITCDDQRLYMVGGNSHSKGRDLVVYDSRAGKWDKLENCRGRHYFNDACCVHKGKLYADSKECNLIEVYDPVAGKWENTNVKRRGYTIKLLSYDNRLYIFSKWRAQEWAGSNFYVQTYDSFLEECSGSLALQNAVGREYDCRSTSSLVLLKNVIMFKS